LFPAKLFKSEVKKYSPFCGVTRDIQKIYLGNFSTIDFINHNTIKIFFFVIFELVWRFLILIFRFNEKNLIKADVVLHLFLVLLGIFFVFFR